MDAIICDALSRACAECELEGGCCRGAMPPLTDERIRVLLANGVEPDQIDCDGYKKLKLKPDGFCVLFQGGRCSIHKVKPETCVAGPFTFDVKGAILEIYLKRESIFPLVRYLKENRSAYDDLFDTSVQKIVDLVERLPSRELAEIVKIEEPETDLVAEIRLKRRLL